MSSLDGARRIIRSSDLGFRDACMAGLFNKRTPDHFPDVLFRAHTVEDIQAAIRMAKDGGLNVSVVSGGHSWSANHMRPNTLVIDMSGFGEFSLDEAAMRATAGPGVGGHELMLALTRRGLFFPVGHCKGVCIGGYLLKGGFGWHSQKLGLACEHVVGLDIVTADGSVVHASEAENSDLYWAARGAGSGFFGVVFRYHLRLFRKPASMGTMVQGFTLDHLEDVLAWAHETLPEIDDNVEFQLFIERRPYLFGRIAVEASVAVFAESRAQALASVDFMRRSPLKRRARLRTPLLPVGMRTLYWLGSQTYVDGERWNVDNMWTHASAEDLLPGIRRALDDLPPGHSHIFWHYWNPKPQRPDFSFSMEDQIYLGLYGNWRHARDDDRYGSWATDHVRSMEAFSTGIQLADENLNHRTAKFMDSGNLSKLDEIRSRWDAEALFNEWHSRPEA